MFLCICKNKITFSWLFAAKIAINLQCFALLSLSQREHSLWHGSQRSQGSSTAPSSPRLKITHTPLPPFKCFCTAETRPVTCCPLWVHWHPNLSVGFFFWWYFCPFHSEWYIGHGWELWRWVSMYYCCSKQVLSFLTLKRRKSIYTRWWIISFTICNKF